MAEEDGRTKKVQIDMCPGCQTPYDSSGGALSRCSLCTTTSLAESYHEAGKPGLAADFATRPETNDPNWKDSILGQEGLYRIEQGEPMDMAWRLLKGDV